MSVHFVIIIPNKQTKQPTTSPTESNPPKRVGHDPPYPADHPYFYPHPHRRPTTLPSDPAQPQPQPKP